MFTMMRYAGVPLVYLGLSMSAPVGTAQAQDMAQTGVSAFAPSFTKVGLVAVATDRANSHGASWVDYDGDGDLDLFVANIDGTGNFLYRNNGTGALERVTTGALATDQIASHGVCWADFDNDDDLDAFVVGQNSRMYVNDGAGDFSVPDPMVTFGTNDLRGWSCAWADYNLDGYVDLMITHPANFVGNPAIPNLLFSNHGDGTLVQITDGPVTTGLAPYTVGTWSDYDLDGDPDLFIGAGPASGTLGPDFIYRNMMVETGTPDLVRVTEGPLATKDRDGQVFNWIDYDNDGDLDVYVTNWGGVGFGGLRDELYRNDDGILTEITTGSIVTDKQVSLGSTWGDFDNDGDLDAYVSDGNPGGTSRFYDNNGDGTFSRLIVGPLITDQGVSWGATAGDFDGDGDLDLFVANASANSINFLYRNDQQTGNHWLKVRTIGTASNRAGIGAILRARATIGGVATWMMREVSSQNSFNGHNDLTIHFGLGDAEVVDSLLVTWPSGAQDLYLGVAADQMLQATEGESPITTDVEEYVVPEGFALETNYPNPFSESTSLVFTLPRTEYVTLTVHDTLGRLVAVPVSGLRESGRHEVRFNGTGLPVGSYVYRLSAGDRVAQGVMVSIK